MKKKIIIIILVVLVMAFIIHSSTPIKLFSINWWKSLFPPKMINISDQLPKGSCAYAERSLDDITDINIHHTAGPSSQDPTMLANYHVNNKGWCGIAYHILVYPDAVYLVNPLNKVSWHNGFNNANAVGVALVGNFDDGPPPKKQLDLAINTVRYLRRILPNAEYTAGHREVAGTKCPGIHFDMDNFRSQVGGKARS